VNSRVSLAIALGLAGAASLGATAAYAYFRQRRRRKSPEEIERLRRLEIHQRGRLTVGTALECFEPPAEAPAALVIVYRYEVAGVIYEVGQDCTALAEGLRSTSWLPGQTISIKYDLKSPSNSIIACEEWNGFPKDPVTPASNLPFSPTMDRSPQQS
jgi:hypothetical protein